METVSTVQIKVCCIQNQEEAQLAIRMGANALGLVGRMPSGPGPISDDRIAALARIIPAHITSVLLTSEQSVDGIVAHHKRTGTSAVQIVDTITSGTLRDLRRELPGAMLMQVIHVEGERSLAEALTLQDDVDALLLDSGRPGLPVKELGGTGRTHDWDVSRRIRDAVKRPVFLAGGLRPENVREAVERVQPFAVDVCSGVRTNGVLDPQKLSAFIAHARGLS